MDIISFDDYMEKKNIYTIDLSWMNEMVMVLSFVGLRRVY